MCILMHILVIGMYIYLYRYYTMANKYACILFQSQLTWRKLLRIYIPQVLSLVSDSVIVSFSMAMIRLAA